MASQVPILRIAGGLFFILAAVVYYYHVALTSSFAIVFIAAGAAVLALGVFGHRANGGDIAVFVLGLLVLSASLASGFIWAPGGGQRVTYTVPRTALSAQQVSLITSADFGSLSVFFSTRTDLAYQVNFTRTSTSFLSLFSGVPSTSLTNETSGQVFVLNATARGYDVSVAIGTGFALSVDANAGTGSVSFRSLPGEKLGTVALQSGTGSVSSDITSVSVGAIRIQAGTGSVSINSQHLAPTGAKVPISATAGTGSVNLSVKLAAGTAVTIDASAGFGSISHNLQGFTVSPQSSRSHLTASAGDVNTAADSFVVTLSAGTGSVNADTQFLG